MNLYIINFQCRKPEHKPYNIPIIDSARGLKNIMVSQKAENDHARLLANHITWGKSNQAS